MVTSFMALPCTQTQCGELQHSLQHPAHLLLPNLSDSEPAALSRSAAPLGLLAGTLRSLSRSQGLQGCELSHSALLPAAAGPAQHEHYKHALERMQGFYNDTWKDAAAPQLFDQRQCGSNCMWRQLRLLGLRC
jgi:hypothetical protein